VNTIRLFRPYRSLSPAELDEPTEYFARVAVHRLERLAPTQPHQSWRIDVQEEIERWWQEYTSFRPHSSLQILTPNDVLAAALTVEF